MFDYITVASDAIIVTSNKFILKLKKLIFWTLIAFCSCTMIVIINRLNMRHKYLLVILFAAILAYYKLVYLKLNVIEKKLCVSARQIEYYDGTQANVIPIADIIAIEDLSKYYDFQGHNERQWHHAFVIRFRKNCQTLDIAGKQSFLCNDELSEIVVNNLLLKHEDYEFLLQQVYKYLEK